LLRRKIFFHTENVLKRACTFLPIPFVFILSVLKNTVLSTVPKQDRAAWPA
jgi:hypothetical protein